MSPALSQVSGDEAEVSIVDNDETLLDEITVIGAREQLKQAPGVSIITREDITIRPPSNDLSEIIRRMPGVNLTGNSATGQRGNNRQIDLRGMGPENTLILIDGKPVLSRNSVKMGSRGERDTRGDTNWVPAEAVERIEVIRGPAAARYGSGAAGGVVNIITKQPDADSRKVYGSLSTYFNFPQHQSEGSTRRVTAVLGGRVSDELSFRIFSNFNKTSADSLGINANTQGSNGGETIVAGREGVRNFDVQALLAWKPLQNHAFDLEFGFSRQGNIYSGDTQNGTTNSTITSLYGKETNTLLRNTLALSHHGDWGFATSESYIQWERTRNKRFNEGLTGSVEGAINATGKGTITLDNLTAKSEWQIPFTAFWRQNLTVGAEIRAEWMNDPVSNQQSLPSTTLGVAADPSERSNSSDAQLYGIYLEDNIFVSDKLTVTPGVRFDYHSDAGSNLSPSVNAAFVVTDEIKLKAGIARAFKAPNLFQLNPNYVYSSRGNGCPIGTSVSCYIIGNEDLKPETSINKEIGISYARADGLAATLTYFHNDYRNRISAGETSYGTASNGYNIYRWENTPEAVTAGFEGSLNIPILETLDWYTNATYMTQSKDKTTGNPLSLVPEYTINTGLTWTPIDRLRLNVSATFYGETQSRIYAENRIEYNNGSGGTLVSTESRKPYTIVNTSLNYQVKEGLQFGVGINNIFDKRLLREANGNNAGANTYNEPGRTYWFSSTISF